VQHANVYDAGVVHQYVQTAEFSYRGLNGLLNIIGSGNVTLNENRLVAVRGNLFYRIPAGGWINIGNDNGGAFFGKELCRPGPDASPGATDPGYLTF
jgi:hypothetical protein